MEKHYTLHPVLKNKPKACNMAIDIVNFDIYDLVKGNQVSLYSETTGEEIGKATIHSFAKNAICVRCTMINGCASCIYQLKPENLN